ncbi:hypothetical protein MLD38_023709 [Melastoma candidum]|uniref:Uncharacterized protein n=1 Tax=Melastoma candidum TaxID=119954 RepID=A0ACB9NPZ2_9MYRT|nr:hypothetical protein MLD38_023709 [Melastoma candidum]
MLSGSFSFCHFLDQKATRIPSHTSHYHKHEETMSLSTEEFQELLPPTDPFFPFGGSASPDESFDIFASVGGFQNDVEEETDMSSALFVDGSGSGGFRYSSSPPCQQLENLTLYQSNWSYPMEDQPGYDCFGSVKRENMEPGRQGYGDDAFISCSYDGGCDEFNKFMMQRNGFGDETREISNVHAFSDGWMDLAQHSFFGEQMRRVSSTGDLQFSRTTRARGSSPRSFTSPLAGENTNSITVGDQNAKAVRCSPEEKKEKILKYRAKRAQRNFNKTIKYVCRKTLADTRPRIRGRFARNDEVMDPPKSASLSNNDEDDSCFWAGLGEEGGEETCATSYGHDHGETQLLYYYDDN